MRSLVRITLIALVLAGCTQPTYEPDPIPSAGPEAVRFLVIGDTGTGTFTQKKVSEAMEMVCIDVGCDFALLLGDAIYESGVNSADDAQFRTKFEQPYANFSIPFYVVLGNHDYGSHGTTYDASKATHYLDYAKRSTRWTMPGMTYVVDTGPVDLFALDSVALAAPGSPTAAPGASAAEQQAWLSQALAASDAPWKMTFAHHPYISNGVHGDAGSYDRTPGRGAAWKELLESTACGNVDFHLAGHDHDLQWLKPVPACGDTEFIISGAAAKQRGPGSNDHAATFEAYATYGFLWMQATNTELTVRAYDDGGKVLMQSTRSA